MKLTLPSQVNKAIAVLEQNGFSAFAVGGCVRDCLMSRTPGDWDLCTGAKPEEIKEAFAAYRTLDIGLAHGTITVIIEHMVLEITTYRLDGIYTDCRHPETVVFTKDIEADLSRRDFTINAIAYSPSAGLVDLFGGIADIQSKTIRAVGDGDKRFAEDALRIIRGVRFASVLGFSIQEETGKSIHKNAHLLVHISGERKNQEFTKLLLGVAVDRAFAQYFDVILYTLPKVCLQLVKDIPEAGAYIGDCLAHTSVDLVTRLAQLFYLMGFTEDVTGQSLETLLKAMKYENKIAHDVAVIYSLIETPMPISPPAIKALLHHIGVPALYRLMALKAGLLLCGVETKIDSILSLQKTKYMLKDILHHNACYDIKQLALGGKDLLPLGLEGKAVGEMLEYLLERVWEDDSLNKKETLLGLVKQRLDTSDVKK